MERRNLLRLAVIIAAPLLMAPHCKAVYPNWPASPPAPYPFHPPYPFDPDPGSFPLTQFLANAQYVEPKLTQAGTNSVVVLGWTSNWVQLEPCNPCQGTKCGGITWPTGSPDNIGGRHVGTEGNQSYRCNYNFSYLDAYLNTHVDPYGSRTTRRNFLVQFGPIFTNQRATPPYLSTATFDSATMKTAFHAFLDRAMPRITAHAFSGQNVAAVGLGNEVNAYLNSQPSYPTPWDQYSSFVADAVDYINSPSHLNITTTAETVTTTWYGFCGIGHYFQYDPNCLDKANHATSLENLTEVFTFTYYPNFYENDTALANRIQSDFGYFEYVSLGYSKQVLLQEAGYPTSGPYCNQASDCPWMPQGPCTNHACPAPLGTQTQFVNKLFEFWPSYADYVGGISYHSVYDFPTGVFMPTGFFTNAAVDKGGWSNFVSKTAPP